MATIKHYFYTLVGLAVFSLGLLSIIIFQYGSDWDCVVGDTYHNYIPSRSLHDETMIKSGEIYPVCYNLKKLEDDIHYEESNFVNATKRYKALWDRGNLHCGRIRVKDSVLGLNFHFTTKFDCTPDIIAGKRRLFTYIKQLCHKQKDAHIKHKRLLLNSQNTKDSLNQTTSQSHHESNNTSKIESSIPVKESVSHVSANTYGVIYTGQARHFKKIYQSIVAHRHLHMNLRIEVWSNLFDTTFCLETLGQLQNVHCLSLPSISSGFASKFYALLLTRMQHVVFMDADNLAVRNIQELFDSVEYKQSGFILWPDLCGHRCKSAKVNLGRYEHNTYHMHDLF